MHRRHFLAAVAVLVLAPRARAASPTMIVHHDPSCGCCAGWVLAFRQAGYVVQTQPVPDVAPVKQRLGVPEALQSCHTAEIAGYFLEGHVPIAAVAKLLAERPAVRGLAVAGMPVGSLGMGEDPRAAYDVMAVPREGPPSVFQAVRPL